MIGDNDAAAWRFVMFPIDHLPEARRQRAGATRRLSAVRWALGSTIVMAWMFAMSVSAAIAAIVRGVLRLSGMSGMAHG